MTSIYRFQIDLLAVPARFRSRFFSLAAADHFFEDLPRAFFSATAINALPLSRDRDGKGIETLKFLRVRMSEDQCGVLLFPEGTRTRTGDMGTFRSGIGMLAAGSPFPVVPCYLFGAFAAWPAGRRFPLPRKLKLYIGKPLVFAAEANDPEGWKRVARTLEEAVHTLKRMSESNNAVSV